MFRVYIGLNVNVVGIISYAAHKIDIRHIVSLHRLNQKGRNSLTTAQHTTNQQQNMRVKLFWEKGFQNNRTVVEK